MTTIFIILLSTIAIAEMAHRIVFNRIPQGR